MCGVVGVYGHDNAAQIAFQIMRTLQNRGQDSYGVKVSHNRKIRGPNPQPGLLKKEFEDQISGLEGKIALAHLRYSTAGNHNPEDNQPIAYDKMAIAHNGNLTNALELRARLKGEGRTFKTPGSDTEVILQLAAISKEKDIEDKFIDAFSQVKGAYSIVAIWDDTMIIAKDPHGYRPLAIGRWANGTYLAASECQALERNGAKEIQEVEPGELIAIDSDGYKTRKFGAQVVQQKCLIELIYFANPAGQIFGLKRGITWIREEHGRLLARGEQELSADIVIPVPDSGMQAAIGYAAESGIPYRMGLLRSHSAGRTFTLSTNEQRAQAVSDKLISVRDVLEGQRVIVVDDSIIRGTSSKEYIKRIRNAGAVEVHLRIASPPFISPCYYGIDTPTKTELAAAQMSVEEIRSSIGADSLRYLSIEDLHRPIYELEGQTETKSSCDACFTGNYADNLVDNLAPSRLPIVRG